MKTVKKVAKKSDKKVVAKVEVKETKKGKTGPAIGERKNLLYKYPTECNDLSKRKLFRASTRGKLASLRKDWKLKESGKREGDATQAKAAYFAFKKKHFMKAEETDKSK